MVQDRNSFAFVLGRNIQVLAKHYLIVISSGLLTRKTPLPNNFFNIDTNYDPNTVWFTLPLPQNIPGEAPAPRWADLTTQEMCDDLIAQGMSTI